MPKSNSASYEGPRDTHRILHARSGKAVKALSEGARKRAREDKRQAWKADKIKRDRDTFEDGGRY